MLKRKGFTLVEIMIVVAVISLVASIAIPNFVKAISTAQQNTCIENLKQIQSAIQMWALNNNKQDTDNVTMNDLVTGTASTSYLRSEPFCPVTGSGGAHYVLNTVAANPRCPNLATYPGHTLGDKPAPPIPNPPNANPFM